MVLYGTTLTTLDDELKWVDSGIIPPLYSDDAEFDGLARQSAQLLKLLMERGLDQGYLPNPTKSFFILDIPDQEEAAKIELEAKGIKLKFVRRSRYLGAYMGPQEELATWVKPQV